MCWYPRSVFMRIFAVPMLIVEGISLYLSVLWLHIHNLRASIQLA